MDYNIYKDIALRTKGDIYIGVVGPVRTGKSTFIRRFMDLAVLPNLEEGYDKQRTEDELPQSAQGKTIMTTEPKFVPSDGATITLSDELSFNVKMIDCVGYLVKGASGYMDGDAPRMVSTPWSDDKLPFAQAAEIGTSKVISQHSTVGVVMTTDGSFSEIPREDYILPEERVIRELKALGKPFVVVLNTSKPYAKETQQLVQTMSENYKARVLPINCLQLKEENIHNILETLLYEFPLSEIDIKLPKWVETLSLKHWLKSDIINQIKNVTEGIKYLYQVKSNVGMLKNGNIKNAYLHQLDLGTGKGNIELVLEESLFYKMLSETTGSEIADEYQLISILKELTGAKEGYDKIKDALEQVNMKGYGVVTPPMAEMTTETPAVVKQGNGFGVSIKAKAPVIHMIKTDIETMVEPVVGSESQSKELAEYLKDTDNFMEYKIFGKSVGELIEEDLRVKMTRLPDDARDKFRETIEKIVNEGNGGLICILL